MANNYDIIGLYEHNALSYEKVKASFNTENVVGIVHATGTGKSYNALELIYDNKSLNTLYITPALGIIEHIKKIINDNPNLELERDFPNLNFKTYQTFLSLNDDEIGNIPCDLLILDEFHHIGAPIWGSKIDKLIKTHPNIKIFGMTAYTVRDRGTSYERDMVNPEADELFSSKIVSRYDLCDAMIDGVLPKPIYKTAYINLMEYADKIETRLDKMNHESKEYIKYSKILADVKRKIHVAPSIPDILKKNIKPNGKYIYFCPPSSKEGINDIETIKKEAIEWFKTFIPEEDIVIYTTTSDMKELGKKNRDAFYDDVALDGTKVDNKLRVMFAINQYNEGIHAPNIDGVILGRSTSSEIVYFEQLGRALSVRGNTKDEINKLSNYSLEELVNMCKAKDIQVNKDITKTHAIELLISPIVIDLTNNFDFIKKLENNLKDRIKDIDVNRANIPRNMIIEDAIFDIEVINQDLFEMLNYLNANFYMSWEEYYEYAKKYYEQHGDLEVPFDYTTEEGIKLGHWVFRQRSEIKEDSEKGVLLSLIGMRFKRKKRWLRFDEAYEYAKKYYEHHGNLEVPRSFCTNDGYTYNSHGIINLGAWVVNQRCTVNPESEKGIMLKNISMRFETKTIYTWEEMYEYAKKYYEHHGNLEVPKTFKTDDGYTYSKNGKINLGCWINNQRFKVDLESERGILLVNIGMRFTTTKILWMDYYNLAKAYYEHYGNLNIPKTFKTLNGIDYLENGITLGTWLRLQRSQYLSNRLGKEQIELLENIGMIWDVYKYNRDKYSKLIYNYYKHYGNLDIPTNFKTLDGINYDETGLNLYDYINKRKSAYRGNLNSAITLEQIKEYEEYGIVWFSDEINQRLQNEIITDKNITVKQKELRNRFYSLISTYDDDYLPSKEEINSAFVKKLTLRKK